MPNYEFTLIVEGRDLQADAAIDALFEAGCDDALVGRADSVQYLDFDREAESVEDAILSAVAGVERIDGVEVIRLAGAGLVSMTDIAARVQRSRESVRLLVAAKRGPGGFPPPVTTPRSRYRLWRWSEVERWFTAHFGDQPEHRDDHVAAAINAGLELRHHSRYVRAGRRGDLRELAGF